jgi:hypothetical protein
MSVNADEPCSQKIANVLISLNYFCGTHLGWTEFYENKAIDCMGRLRLYGMHADGNGGSCSR